MSFPSFLPLPPAIPAQSPKHRAGLIVPYDMALDHEMWRWAPADISLLFTRTPNVGLAVTLEMAQAVGDLGTLRQCARDLVSVSPEVLAYGCTSGSFVNGLRGERQMVEAMQEVSGSKAVTTSGALIAALEHLGVQRVAVATPYDAAVTARLGTFLEEAAVQVVAGAHLDLHREIWRVPYQQTADLIRAADSADAQAVVVSCTNLATYDVIPVLEAELGKPVVSANQATMWATARALGRQAVGRGQRLIDLLPKEPLSER